MGDFGRPAMSDSERDVLKVLWEHGPLTAREVLDILNNAGQKWSRSTVITLLQRLEKKGYVESDKSEFAFIFRATLTREEVIRTRIEEMAHELCDGKALPLVLSFAEGIQFSAADLKRFRDMIDGLEAKQKKKGKQ